MDNQTAGQTHITHDDRVVGCIRGGAIGDALGYVVESDSWVDIERRFGSKGLTSPEQTASEPLTISDDTQLTLFTLAGLTEAIRWANEGSAADELACLWLDYLRWYRTQGAALPASAPDPPASWLERDPAMRHQRHPGTACLSGLETGVMGGVQEVVNPDAKGCGTVMRSAPFGLVPHAQASDMAQLAMRASALTHGHPSAGHSAAALTTIINQLCAGASVSEAATAAITELAAAGDDARETHDALARALETAHDVVPLDPPALTERFGAGWLAHEALAIAVYCSLVEDAGQTPTQHFTAAVARAVNHDGDSDSTAAITGNILGARYGVSAIPGSWWDRVAERSTIDRVIEEFVAATHGAR